MGTGRHAADVALTTSFGRMKMSAFNVFTDDVTDDPGYEGAFQPPLPLIENVGTSSEFESDSL